MEEELNHIPLDITAAQRANLEKLAAYLATGVTAMTFHMGDYCVSEENGYTRFFPPERATCGTVGCAVGHGPAAGITVPRDCEYWNDYSKIAFGAHAEHREEDPLYIWCFYDSWKWIDDTPWGAAARIRYALDHGIPENYKDQSSGAAPRSYRVPA